MNSSCWVTIAFPAQEFLQLVKQSLCFPLLVSIFGSLSGGGMPQVMGYRKGNELALVIHHMCIFSCGVFIFYIFYSNFKLTSCRIIIGHSTSVLFPLEESDCFDALN